MQIAPERYTIGRDFVERVANSLDAVQQHEASSLCIVCAVCQAAAPTQKASLSSGSWGCDLRLTYTDIHPSEHTSWQLALHIHIINR